MELYTNGVRNAEFILSEANSERSREQVLIPSGQGKLPAGTMLTASNTKAVDGASAVKVLYGAVDATDGPVEAAVVARDAEVHGELLNWESNTTQDEKLLAAVSLATSGIIVRWTERPIASGDADHLEFFAFPASGTEGESIGPVIVHVKDIFGSIANGSSASITLTKTTGAGTLNGGGAVAAVNGVATWPAVAFSADGTFTFTAAASGIDSAVSGNVVIANP